MPGAEWVARPARSHLDVVPGLRKMGKQYRPVRTPPRRLHSVSVGFVS